MGVRSARGSTIRETSTMPAGSASSRISRVRSRIRPCDGLFMLENLTHRGAVGADPLMGDGAGILVQIPDRFFHEEMAQEGVTLSKAGEYAVGYLFMPRDEKLVAHFKDVISEVVAPLPGPCLSTIRRSPRRRTSPRPNRIMSRCSSVSAERQPRRRFETAARSAR